MTTLYLDQSDLEIRADGHVLAMYRRGERCGCVPIKLLERVVIRGGQIRLDSGVLLKLAEAGATTVFISPRIGKRVAIVLGPAHNDAAVRLAQAQRVLDPEFCATFARGLINAKLRRQQRTLQAAMTQRPDARKPLFDALQALERATETLAAPALEIASIRGIEGAAARAYFQGFTAIFPPALAFTGRNRRPPRDPVNACLSLAYTMLHVDAVRAAHCAGLDPLLGFYHRPAIGRESLASDLVEPLRPVADAWVWQMWRQRIFREDQFSTAAGACLLGKSGRARFYKEWEAQALRHRRWLRKIAAEIAHALRAEGAPWLVNEDDP